jgi:endonuclease/exonuclease/phosphatase family metal-dependent hydrolase
MEIETVLVRNQMLEQVIGTVSIPMAELGYRAFYNWLILFNESNPTAPTGRLKVRIVIDPNVSEDFDEYNPSVIKRCASQLLSPAVSENIPFTLHDEENELRLFCMTWNAGNGKPPELDDDMNLNTVIEFFRRRTCHMYVISLQESDFQTPSGQSVQNAWLTYFDRVIGTDVFMCLCHHGLSQIRMYIYIRRDMLSLISGVHVGDEATGFGNVMANKGGVAISMTVGNQSVCFVNSHLAAHQENSEQRNQQYSDLVRGLHVGSPRFDLISQFNHVIWMGDLNYRIDYNGTDPEKAVKNSPSEAEFEAFHDAIRVCAGKANFRELFELDQLQRMMKENKAFTDFKEAEINYNPTFKVAKGKLLEYSVSAFDDYIYSFTVLEKTCSSVVRSYSLEIC